MTQINKHLEELGVESIEKGIVDTLSRDSLYKKSGEEIKVKLAESRQRQVLDKDSRLAELIAIRKQIPIEPTECIRDWQLRGILFDKNNLPKQYSYCTYQDDEGSCISVAARSILLTPEKALSKQDRVNIIKYNEILDKYISDLVELVYTDTLINNIEDKKQYELNLEQLVSLGF